MQDMIVLGFPDYWLDQAKLSFLEQKNTSIHGPHSANKLGCTSYMKGCTSYIIFSVSNVL